MKKIIFILMVLAVAAMPWAGSKVQAGSTYSIEWIRQFGSTLLDTANSVATDASGNVYVAGMTRGTLPGCTSLGNNDAFVRKYNSAGVEQWTRQFGTSDNDEARGVSVDSSGNVFVAGYTDGAFPDYTNLGNADIFIRKYNSEGVEQWTRQFGSNTDDFANSVAVDASGNVFIAGHTFGSLPGQSSSGDYDAFVCKYNSDGLEQWTRQFGTSAYDGAQGVAVDSAGNAYVAGCTAGAFPGYINLGLGDAFVRKYNSDGLEQWTRQFGTISNEVAYGICADSSGNVFVVGNTSGAFPGYTNLGNTDAFIRKYNSGEVEQWTRQFGTSAIDYAWGVSVDSSGNIYVVGSTYGAFPFYTNLGSSDAFIRQYNSAGLEQWTRQFGTIKDDGASSVAVDSSGNAYLAGYTGGTLPGQSNAGLQDAFVMKFTFTTQYRTIYPAEYRWSTVFTPKTQMAPSPASFMTWQQVRFENKGVIDAYNVTGTITWVPANVTIIDGQVSFGNIPAGSSTWSTDDFALVTDMTNAQPSKQGILWRVEYDDVLGGHHVMENVPQLTKGMVDTQQTGGKSK